MRLSETQLKLLAETLSNVGLIFFASMVAPFFTGSELKEAFVLSGLSLSIGSWILSLFIIKGTEL